MWKGEFSFMRNHIQMLNFCARFFLSILTGILIFAPDLQAQDLDPLTGVRVSLASTQALLAVPPLPSLETEGRSTFSVSGSYLKASTAVVLDETLYYDGKFEGAAFGIGYTSRSFGRLNYFWMLVANHLSGSIDVNQADGTTLGTLKDISTQGYSGAGGASYRFIGDNKSPFAAGFFFGPAFMYFKNEFKLQVQQSGVQAAEVPVYSSSPLILGALGGLQLKLRLGNLLIIPYGLYVSELSEKCKSYSSTNNDTSLDCEGTPGKINMPGSFAAFGLNLGYKAIRLNAYSSTSNDPTMKNIKVNQYQLSYAWGLD